METIPYLIAVLIVLVLNRYVIGAVFRRFVGRSGREVTAKIVPRVMSATLCSDVDIASAMKTIGHRSRPWTAATQLKLISAVTDLGFDVRKTIREHEKRGEIATDENVMAWVGGARPHELKSIVMRYVDTCGPIARVISVPVGVETDEGVLPMSIERPIQWRTNFGTAPTARPESEEQPMCFLRRPIQPVLVEDEAEAEDTASGCRVIEERARAALAKDLSAAVDRACINQFDSAVIDELVASGMCPEMLLKRARDGDVAIDGTGDIPSDGECEDVPPPDELE